MTDRPTVAVIGLGYIGLPTAAVLATHGCDVVGVDVNARTVDAVNRGEVPFIELDLEIAVAEATSRGSLRAQTTPLAADAFIVAVPTPLTMDRLPDLSYVEAAADAIAPHVRADDLVILESTSPPGTTRHMAGRVLARRPDLSLDGEGGRGVLHFAHCPERVLPGRIMVELVANDRIVGGLTPEAAERARALYARFCQGEILLTDAVTAEFAKLVENAYRDVNIAFANEIAAVGHQFHVDPWRVIELANRHPRVNVLRPGPGVGGHCIAVDPWFIAASAPGHTPLIRAAREVNEARPREVVEHAVAEIERAGVSRTVVLGLTYKADVDDLRESPARQVVNELAARLPHVQVDVIEPNIQNLPSELSDRRNVALVRGDGGSFDGSAVLLLVGHASFRALKEACAKADVVMDVCGLWRVHESV